MFCNAPHAHDGNAMDVQVDICDALIGPKLTLPGWQHAIGCILVRCFVITPGLLQWCKRRLKHIMWRHAV